MLDLSIPAVAPPAVGQLGADLACAVPWGPADAETAAFAWQRDGVPLRSATAARYRPTAADRGHAITCSATARNAWCSITLSSPLASRLAGARAVAARPSLTGRARTGSRLRCSATMGLRWLRDGRVVAGRHARTYRVRAVDSGHSIACETTIGDGSRLRSRSLRIASVAA